MDNGAAKKIEEEKEKGSGDSGTPLRFTAQERAKNVLTFPVPTQEENKTHSKTNTKTQIFQNNSIQDLQHEGPVSSIAMTPEIWQKMVEELVLKLVEKLQVDQVKQLQNKVNELSAQVQLLKNEIAHKTGTSVAAPVVPKEQKIKGVLKLLLQKYPDLKTDILLIGQDLDKLKLTPKFKEHALIRIKVILQKKPAAKADLAMLEQIILQSA